MKSVLLTLLILFSPVVSAQVMSDTTLNNNGQTLFRVMNRTPVYINCLYKDDYNYFTFAVPPFSYSMWYPVYGQYIWRCG